MRVVAHCPAKINLFLSVGPLDATGYHPIRTVMQAVSLFDTLTVTTGARSTSVRSSWADLPAENTLTKTLRMVGEFVKVPPLDVYLEKRIPAESGLGGGSSDAAGLLRALQKVLVAPLPEHALTDVATSVGMDVPFFLLGGRAAAEGYGERLTALPDTESRHLIIVRPPIGCPTADAYAALDDLSYEWREIGEDMYNDFERVAPCESLDLIELLKLCGASGAGLSGSGSAAFGFFESAERASMATDLIREGGHSQCWAAHTLNRSESLVLEH